jgi:hypothetical protein
MSERLEHHGHPCSEPDPPADEISEGKRDLMGSMGEFERALRIVNNNDDDAIEPMVNRARIALCDIINWHEEAIERA